MAEPRPIHPGLFVDGPDGPRLLAGRCASCVRLHFPASRVCPYCAADDCRETAVGPSGRLWLYTVVATRPPGYRGDVPYGFGVVELAEGLRVIARLAETRLDALRAGLAMRLAIEPLFTDDDGGPVVSYVFHAEAP